MSSLIYEMNIGLHVALSVVFWWASLILMAIAYKHRHIWNIGNAPWNFLILAFLFFGMRELGHFNKVPVLVLFRYTLGIWSAIFMTSAFLLIFIKIYKRKRFSSLTIYAPLLLSLIFPVIFFYLYFSSYGIEDVIFLSKTVENLIWILGSAVVIYTTYLIGTRVSNGFIKVFMFFQFSAFAAFTWKFMGLLEQLSWALPYQVREVVETVFGIFALIAVSILVRMLRNLSRDIHS